MSDYTLQPLDFSGLKTVTLHGCGGKCHNGDVRQDPPTPGAPLSTFLNNLPKILAAKTQKSILWGHGGHVIKVGLAPTLLDLADKGYAHGFSMNGSATIHDYEIAVAGHPSEDVEAVLSDAKFANSSLLHGAYARKIPVTVHVAIGTITPARMAPR